GQGVWVGRAGLRRGQGLARLAALPRTAAVARQRGGAADRGGAEPQAVAELAWVGPAAVARRRPRAAPGTRHPARSGCLTRVLAGRVADRAALRAADTA